MASTKKRRRRVVTYAASMAPNANTTYLAVITATDGNAFAIAPTGRSGRRIHIEIRNGSGGALGAITWTGCTLVSAFTAPADGLMRRISFVNIAGDWREIHRQNADLAYTTLGRY